MRFIWKEGNQYNYEKRQPENPRLDSHFRKRKRTRAKAI